MQKQQPTPTVDTNCCDEQLQLQVRSQQANALATLRSTIFFTGFLTMADTAQTADSATAYFFSSNEKKIGKKQKSKTNGGTAASPAADAFDRFSSSGSGPETPTVSRDADDDVDVEEEPPSTAKRIRLDSDSSVLVHQSSTIPPEFLDAPVTCRHIS